MSALQKSYRSAPSALAYMFGAFKPSPGWNDRQRCADFRLRWRGYHVDPDIVDQLASDAGAVTGDAFNCFRILYPQVTGFRLLMAMLTHPSWPLPIWRALQVRNRLLLHRAFQPGDEFDLEASVSGWRVLAKGLEIDLHLSMAQGSTCCWESIVTFYYRGRYGDEIEQGAVLGADPASPVLADAGLESATWIVGEQHRWRYGGLTGDYNGLHQWDWYAHRMGFPAAFPHPQRIIAQCLAHLPEPGGAPQQLDLWIKGPVFFGREVTLRHAPAATTSGRLFGLWLAGEGRPALLGSLTAMPGALAPIQSPNRVDA